MTFQDYFSTESAAYRDGRPTYPRALFEWLAGLAPARLRAWDCACGNGQASVPLAEFFDEVVATDASEGQIANAVAHPRVRYKVALAEQSGIPGGSVDLVTVAQAAHWLDHGAFDAEARRVLRPGGVVAFWSYGKHAVSPAVDEVMHRYYSEIVGPYWPPERVHVENGYKDIPFPFERIVAPRFDMSLDWNLGQLMSYLWTWSATKRYRAAQGSDPRELVEGELKALWGDAATVRRVSWPLTIHVGRRE